MSEAPPPPEPAPGTPPPPAGPEPAHLEPRALPWPRALAWYEEAMRLFKRAPGAWIALAVATLASEFLLEAIPGVGPLAGKVVVPVIACGMLYAARAADRGAEPSVALALAAFRAPASAIVAIVAAGLLTFAAEAATAWWVADVNLLAPDAATPDLTLPEVAGVYTIGVLASLPLTFVPLHVLFERVSPGAAFVASWRAFVLNTMPLLVYAAASLVLLGFGVATMGLGLVLALPLWAASSYAAWKDVFDVREP
jgi:hypothetical protein